MSKVQIKPCKSLKWVDCNEDCNNCPIVEVGKVKHGRWINCADVYSDGDFECSECHKREWSETDYCPNCGAKMDEV